MICNVDLAPTQGSSHHQDYIFGRESQRKPSFSTVTGSGVDQIYLTIFNFACLVIY